MMAETEMNRGLKAGTSSGISDLRETEVKVKQCPEYRTLPRESLQAPFLDMSCSYVQFSSFLFHIFSSADWLTQILQFFLISLFQDFCFALDTLQSDHMFLYKCHPKHAFSTDIEKAIPVSRIDIARASEYWIHHSSIDGEKIQKRTMHEH